MNGEEAAPQSRSTPLTAYADITTNPDRAEILLYEKFYYFLCNNQHEYRNPDSKNILNIS
jgi:hypothetical protein